MGLMRQVLGESFGLFRQVKLSRPLGMRVRNASLVRSKAFVNGIWKGAASGEEFAVINPADGEAIGSVPNMNENDALEAVGAAYDSFLQWQETTAKERSHHLRKWFDVLQKNQDELAKIITAESGKPLKEAAGEVAYGNSFIEWFSEEARRIHGEVIDSPIKSKEMIFIRRPIGVTALITPWNFPIAMITRKAGAALAAGCTCVVKPAEDTPLTALALAALAEESGLPAGVFNVVTSGRDNAPLIGKSFCESPLVAGISFTGSTEVGKLLYKMCAKGVKRLSLELGGNAPFIVFKNADIGKAVQGAIASKFRNCGQTCVSANRLFVEEEMYDEFAGKFKEAMKAQLILGNGGDGVSTMGPLINDAQTKKVDGIVQDAVKKGARILLGGKKASSVGDRFFEPTLIADVDPRMLCYNEEIFGPIAVLIKFKNEEEVLRLANHTKRGLAGYFFSNDIAQIWRVAKKLEVGMVGINEGIISSAEAAFGGIKESGLGREGSHYGIEEFTYIKYLCFGNL
ncbi:succinate-semialdehyde dehydrogenase, mitochondrial [Ischnura elegans]|uniref:succinate-semialdehyde dehydrogenase, mitochondrial n=1 Tax=Ischnura elegans TaxID=197161 RepID=UPI001ED8814D|nr:succinate-semialdehyde dehydrogenase, mitochondrial [Ischnura elegans]XP_046405317.1 succinate-semialdehyde dehydrogenase, mitochondrial [Ischnura elegans]